MIRAMFLVYEVLLYLVFIITAPFFLVTGLLRGKYLSNFPERMGRYRHRASSHDLWLHAVSVGEAIAARPVVTEIEKRKPSVRLLVTTTTLTGQTTAKRLFPHATVTYFPFDFAFSVRAFLEHHRPAVMATMETEIWPNVTRLASARGIRLVLANARISDRSYPRYRSVRSLLRPVLTRYSAILAREETDRERFLAIGASPSQIEVCGNVKFDYVSEESAIDGARLLENLIAGRPVIVLGSTMAGEDEELIPEMALLIGRAGCFVIIAPRKPERFEVVNALLSTTGIRYARRSELEAAATADLLLLDTFGDLAGIYRYATAAFVGGSLVPNGGHNPIEPAAAGAPVCFGPSMSNFREIAAAFLRQGAAEQVRSAADVARFAESMFNDPGRRDQFSRAALMTVAQNRGAAARTAARIVALMP
jgi:3-deoxy-D-manno-octulosonic-acid transferase